jgi:DNA-binding transcriptional ArsR family regulator
MVVLKHSKQKIQINLPDEETLFQLSELFSVLSEVTRLKIVSTLQKGELCVQDIAQTIDMSVSAVSHQMRLLKTMRLVKFRKFGKMKYYSLDDSHIEQLLQIAHQHVEEKTG